MSANTLYDNGRRRCVGGSTPAGFDSVECFRSDQRVPRSLRRPRGQAFVLQAYGQNVKTDASAKAPLLRIQQAVKGISVPLNKHARYVSLNLPFKFGEN